MELDYNRQIAAEFDLDRKQVDAVAHLLQDGATVPFIARYRKEATGSLDELVITAIRDRLRQMAELEERRAYILQSLERHGHLTAELKQAVEAAPSLTALEDIYLPYRPKRRTKATIAREKGLEPLAQKIFAQTGSDPAHAAAGYIDPLKGIESAESALEGARHIMAEWINEDATARDAIRKLFAAKGEFVSRVIPDQETIGAKFRDYFDWRERAAQAPSHRILAMRRGEREGVLTLAVKVPEDQALDILTQLFVKGQGEDAQNVATAVRDAFKRLMSRSMESEMRMAAKERADAAAIEVFAANLRQLLLAAPLGAKRVMAIDPGFKTGCKLVCLDRQGKLLHYETIFPHTSAKQTAIAAEAIPRQCQAFEVEAIAVGNGTAGRETEAFARQVVPRHVRVVMVNESGASVYSASAVARREFPDLDLTYRGAVSIGRRLMDPLSELVKIDPKAIGVGQYQHDVDQTALKQALDDVVVSCVNAVGVDVNRASAELLTYVSGLGPQLARNIVAYRDQKGAFDTRTDLRHVPRLGPKAFEQSAGFLRIVDGANPLDRSAVHPESYPIVDAMARDVGCSLAVLLQDSAARDQIDLTRYVTDVVGLPTLKDILSELARPGRDPRESFEAFAYAEGISKITDLASGMRLPGIVTNVTSFGAFVDIGVHQDGLVHISELSDRFVKDPAQIVSVHQQVEVTVLEIDVDRNRIALSMKRSGRGKPSPAKRRRSKAKRVAKDAPRPFNNPFADLMKS